MGLFDKLKSAVNFVTGGGARVVVELPPAGLVAGQPAPVRVTVTSTGGAIQATGVFLDLVATEHLHVPGNLLPATPQATTAGTTTPTTTTNAFRPDLTLSRQMFEQAAPLAGPFQLAPNETRVFEGTVLIPPGVQPSYHGQCCRHEWRARGRVEVRGNDPDSGFQPIRVLVG